MGQGRARMRLRTQVSLVTENHAVYTQPEARHRPETPGTWPPRPLNAQPGAHLGEEDIMRDEDGYGRG